MLSPFSLPLWLRGLPFGGGLLFALFAGLVQGAVKLGWLIKSRSLVQNAVAQIAGCLSMSRPNPALKPTANGGAVARRLSSTLGLLCVHGTTTTSSAILLTAQSMKLHSILRGRMKRTQISDVLPSSSPMSRAISLSMISEEIFCTRLRKNLSKHSSLKMQRTSSKRKNGAGLCSGEAMW